MLNRGTTAQNRLSSADPAGGTYQYAHDTAGNPTSVIYPGGAVRTYSYNESTYTQNTSLPYALTGITDELGQRFATFNYNTTGDAISTEHAGGVEKYTVTYDFANSTSTIIDPLGTSRTNSFATLLNVARGTGISEVATGNTYDALNRLTQAPDLPGFFRPSLTEMMLTHGALPW